MGTTEEPVTVTDNHDGQTASFRDKLGVLLPHARRHVGVISLGLILALLATTVTLATPLATKHVLDSLGTNASLSGPVTLLVALLVVGTIAGLTQSFLLGRLAEHIVLDARRSLIHRFLSSRIEQVQRFRTGELVTRVTSDTVLLRSAASSAIVQFVNGTVSLVGTIALMAVLDWQLLLTTLASVVVIGALFAVLLPRVGKATEQAQQAIGNLGAGLEGRLRALRTVKSSRAEAREIARVTRHAEDSARHSVRSVWYSALIDATASGGTQLALIVVLGLGAWRVSSGDLAVSTLVAFLLYALNIVEPIMTLGDAFTSLQTGLAAAARIHETADMVPEDTTATPAVAPVPASPAAPVLALRDVTARYLDAPAPALSEISLEIPRRGHTALVGPSGAGKTTVLSLLLRLINPVSGHLELDGRPYDTWSIDEVRSRFAYVEQETPVIPGTIRDNVLFRADDATDDEAWAALEAVHLADKVRELPGELEADVMESTLSGGERQRLAVARALVRTPDILLLDEATAQLDGITEAAIQQVIEQASATGAVLTIAHRLSTVLGADQIIVLDQGRIRDRGTHPELLARDALYREFITALRIQTETDQPEASAEAPPS
ncbi:ABC transporter ATP-binding protein [Arachnia propionica]|uniref:ABC transporter ATP-binding protein n=2 Tax=Arachnia propionica TaxID=1750 RepID=A0A3P1T3V4_9ACTN|nr:ABC transporter ATP-binding protein [Arachnia propionica]RRD04192.1 ABC transporter ATP-binding protein [Arachnia propionica]